MRLLVLAGILIITAVFVAGCTQPSPTQPPQTILTTPTAVPVQLPATPVPTPISQGSVSAKTIAIKNFAFDPPTLTVSTGSIVRWENRDSVPHRIIFIDKSGKDTDVDSTVLSASQSWSNKFIKPGTYPYYCKIHPEMTGTVIVE